MDDEDRESILVRRNRFVALALGSVAMTTLASCGPCLSPPRDGGQDAAPMPCLSDAGPLDAGSPADASADGGGDADAEAAG